VLGCRVKQCQYNSNILINGLKAVIAYLWDRRYERFLWLGHSKRRTDATPSSQRLDTGNDLHCILVK